MVYRRALTWWCRLSLSLIAATVILWPPALAGAAQGQVADDSGPRMVVDRGVRVVYWPGYRGAAERTLAAALNPLALPGLPPEAVTIPATILLAPSPQVFDSLTGGRAPAWSAGVAIPSTGTIVLPVYATVHTATDDPAITLRHELAHLALHAYLPEPIPRWFDEGYATWASGGWDQGSAWQLRLAILLGRAPPLDSLTLDWPRGADRARFAYLLSASAVSHLATRGASNGLPVLLQVWRAEGTLDAAIRQVYGMTLGQFETEWRKVVRRRYGWLLAISQMTVFWAVVTVLVLVLGSRRRKDNRERLAQMEEEERMLPPPEEEELGVDEELWKE